MGRASVARRYRLVGRALLSVEGAFDSLACFFAGSGGNSNFSDKAVVKFRESVALISVELLDHYLEDLLDLDVSEEELYIKRGGIRIAPSLILAITGLSLALAAGLYAVSTGASFVLSFALTATLSLPFAIIWHLMPQERITRRVHFARLVSQEISRRRGGDGAQADITNRQSQLSEIVKSTTPVQGAAARGSVYQDINPVATTPYLLH